ncbi:hypothetical protein ACW7G2_13850 [Luteimonas sp. A277]
MDGFIIAFSIPLLLIGALGLFYAATGRSPGTNVITRFLFCVRGREQSRGFVALSSSAALLLATFWLVNEFRLGLPIWPSFIALGAYGALLMAAHLKHDDA